MNIFLIFYKNKCSITTYDIYKINVPFGRFIKIQVKKTHPNLDMVNISNIERYKSIRWLLIISE